MLECKAAFLTYEELHEIARSFAEKHSCIKQGCAAVICDEVAIQFKLADGEDAEKDFLKLMKPLDTAGFWNELPRSDIYGWITLTEDMMRRLVEKEKRFSFIIEKTLFLLHYGVLFLEKDPTR